MLLPMQNRKRYGFTLFEVILTIAILGMIMVAITAMMRSSIGLRIALSSKASATQKVSFIMQRVVDDLEGTYLITLKDVFMNPQDRRTPTTFALEPNENETRLALTTSTHRSVNGNRRESDLTYVVYELKEDQKISGRKDLYRSEAPFVPEDIREPGKSNLIAKGVKKFVLQAWNGDAWSRDRWDSNRSDTRNILPHMVLVDIEVYDEDVETAEEAEKNQTAIGLKTVVHIPNSEEHREPRLQVRTIRWY